MRFLIPLCFLVGCTQNETKEVLEEGPPSDVDWGSWELSTTFVSQSAACSDMGANGSNLGTLFAEVAVGDPDQIEMLLGQRTLQGVRNDKGFSVESFDPIPADNTDGLGIGVYLDASVGDEHSFTGKLSYEITTTGGSCVIEVDVDAYWLYYEPPPDCGG